MCAPVGPFRSTIVHRACHSLGKQVRDPVEVANTTILRAAMMTPGNGMGEVVVHLHIDEFQWQILEEIMPSGIGVAVITTTSLGFDFRSSYKQNK